jgi:hypothetical protein
LMEETKFKIQCNTQYKKPKSKHYPLQFGTAPVHTTVLLETVVYLPTGYANSPLDPLTKPGNTDVRAMCKLGVLELADLEKLLLCIQAVIEGKSPKAYLDSA